MERGHDDNRYMLQAIADKLSHQISEIRIRALDSLLSKMRAGLVSEDMICQDDMIILSLVTWFKYEDSSRELDVLEILCQLAPKVKLAKFGILHVLQSLKADSFKSSIHVSVDKLMRLVFANTSGDDHLICPAPTSMTPPSSNAKPSSIVVSTSKQLSADTPSIRLLADHNIKSWRFPFVPLIRNDERTLFDMALRLKSKDMILVENTLIEMLRDTIRDFPPEVFLQRPQLLLNLLDLIAIPDQLRIDSIVASCLTSICSNLRVSICRLVDPASRPSALCVSDAFSEIEEVQYPPRDVSSTPKSVDQNRRSLQESLALRSNLSLEFFANSVIDSVLPVLKNPYKATAYALVLAEIVQFSCFRSDVSPPLDLFTAQLDAFGSVLRFYLKDTCISDTINLLLPIILRFLRRPPLLTSIPNLLGDALGDILCNAQFAQCRPELCEEIFQVLYFVKHPAAMDYADAKSVISAIEKLHNSRSEPLMTRLDLMSQAINGVGYYVDILPTVLDELNDCINQHNCPTLAFDILLRLITYWEDGVRHSVIKYLDSAVLSSNGELPWFVMDQVFLREVIYHGLSDSASGVSVSCGELLVHACTSSPETFLDALQPFRCILEMLDSGDSSLAGVVAFIDSILTPEDRFFASLRRIFHLDPIQRRKATITVRSIVLQHLTQSLYLNTDQSGVLDLNLCKIQDPFDITQDVFNKSLLAASAGSPVFQQRDVENLVKIFCSFNLDLSIRCSASEQLLRFFTADFNGRSATDLLGLVDTLLDQIQSHYIDLLTPVIDDGAECQSILFLSCKLITQAIFVNLQRGQMSGLMSENIAKTLLPLMFHPDVNVRNSIGEALAAIAFNPQAIGLKDTRISYSLSDNNTVNFTYPVPTKVLSFYRCPFKSIHLTPIERLYEKSLDHNQRITRIIRDQMASSRDLPPRTDVKGIMKDLLIRIRDSTRFSELLEATSSLKAFCTVDMLSAKALLEIDDHSALDRFFSTAPLSRDDDIAVITLLDALVFPAANQSFLAKILEIIVFNVLPIVVGRLNNGSGDHSSSFTEVLLFGLLDLTFRILQHVSDYRADVFSSLFNALQNLYSMITLPFYAKSYIQSCYSIMNMTAFEESGLAVVASSCVVFLSSNRLPNSFIGQSGIRSAVKTLLQLSESSAIPPECLMADGSLRWTWRLITDRESQLRAQALSLLTRFAHVPELYSAITSSASAGMDMWSTALHLSADHSQAPIVRQAAIALMATVPMGAEDNDEDARRSLMGVVTYIPGWIRSANSSPSFFLSFLYLIMRLLTISPDAVISQIFDFAQFPMFLRFLDVDSLMIPWTAHVRESSSLLAPNEPINTWSVMEEPVAIECGLVWLDILRRIIDLGHGRDNICTNTQLITNSIRFFGRVMSRPDLSCRIESVVDFLGCLTPSSLVPVLIRGTPNIPADFLKHIGSTLSTSNVSLQCASCQLLIAICEEMSRPDFVFDRVSDDPLQGSVIAALLQRLVRMIILSLNRRSYYQQEPNDSPPIDAWLYGRTLTYLAKIAPQSSKSLLSPNTDPTLKLLLDRIDALHNIAVARQFSAPPGSSALLTPIYLDMQLLIVCVKALLFNCPVTVKTQVVNSLAIGPLTLRIWRHGSEFKSLHHHLLELCSNLCADCPDAKIVLSGQSKKQKRSSILSAIIEIVVNSRTSPPQLTRLALQCLQGFASNSETLPSILRSSVIEACLNELRRGWKSRRTILQSPVLLFLSCCARSGPGQAHVANMLIPEFYDIVLDCCSSKAKSVRIASITFIHNLSFYGPVKPAMLSSTRLITVLVNHLRVADAKTELQTVRLASNTLWSLVYDCQKGCAMVRQQLISQRASLSTISEAHCEEIQHNLERVRALIDS